MRYPNSFALLRNALVALTLFAAPAGARAETTIRVGLQSLPISLGNVHRSTSSSELYSWAAMFDPITMVANDGTVEPWLAESWEALTPTTWHFHIRAGLTFHNGEPLNAAAVVATLNYLISPEGQRENIARIITPVASARAVDDMTVEITTHYPDLMLPAELGIVRVVAPRQWAELGPEGFARDPKGTGPFKVERWSAGRISLTAHQRPWKPPQTDRLELIQLNDPVARTQGILADALDIAIIIGPDQMETLEGAGHGYFVSKGAGAMGIALVKGREGPLADIQVRRALNHAINRQAYIDALLAGTTVPSTQATPSSAIGFDPELQGFDYNPDLARQLLAEAGYADGFTMIVELATGGAAADGAVYQAVAQDFAQIGVELEVRSITIPDMLNKFRSNSWEGDGFNMDFNVKPSMDSLRPFANCLVRDLWHCREDLTPLIRDARAEWDPDTRLSMVHDLLKSYQEAPSMIYLHETVMIDGLNKRLRGYEPVNLIINYHDLTVAEGAN